MATKLSPRALSAYEAHLKRIVKLEERLAAAADRVDAENERMFREVVGHMGLDLEGNWILDSTWFDEFGVVLLREGPELGPDEDDEEFDEEPPRPERRAAN